MPTALARLTIVIPVGPGDTVSPVLYAQLRAALPPETEVRVVCASASDCASLRARVVPDGGPRWNVRLTAPGRATQLNAGAAEARTTYLWFLHADAQLSDGTLPALAAFIDRGEWALGYFDLHFTDDGPAWMWLNTLGTWLRSHWLGLPFGDQGFVLPRMAFGELAGFDTRLEAGEDHDLVWRARSIDLPLRPLRAVLYTSARKYAEHGWLRTTRRHVVATWRQARRFSQVREVTP